MKRIFVLIACLTTVSLNAQIYPQVGARSISMGGVGLTLNDVYSVYNNPGALGALDKTSIGLNYENRFLVKEISSQAIVYAHKGKKNGNFGVQIQQTGFSLYREIQAGVVYGVKLSDKFYGGVGLNYHRIQLGENYGTRNTASGNLGVYYEANKSLRFGVRVQNISRTKLAELEDERLPTRFGLGLTYLFSKKISWSLEAEKTIINPINVKTGLEIHPHDIVYIRLGINSFPFQSAFGFGLVLDKFQFDMSANWHSTLGMSPSAGLKFSFD